jgi:hypothetical protein
VGGGEEDPIICQYSIIFHKEKNRKLENVLAMANAKHDPCN